jgi:hypothetical protein
MVTIAKPLHGNMTVTFGIQVANSGHATRLVLSGLLYETIGTYLNESHGDSLLNR